MENNQTKTFTEEEVNKMIQSQNDKIRTEYSNKIKTIEEELNKYKPKEKSENEIELENKIKQLEQKEKELAAKENQFKINNILETNGLPTQLGKYLNATGVQDLESYVGEVKEIINKQIINSSFKPSNHGGNKGITKEEFKNMSYEQQLNLYNSNKELYNQLSQ